MAKIRTNFIELLLRQTLVGQQMYLDNGTLITIDEIDYQPIIKEVYVKSGNDGYKLSVDVNYDFELTMDDRNKIVPNKGRIKGGNKVK